MLTRRIPALILGLATVGSGIAVTGAEATEILAFSQVVAGTSTCGTFTSPIPTVNGFSFGSAAISNPVGGNAACGVKEAFPPPATAAAGVVSTSADFVGATFDGNVLNGSAEAIAQSGKVGARAKSSLVGTNISGSTVKGAQGAGVFSETFVLSDAALNGTPGTVQFGMALDGELEVVGAGGFSSSIGLFASYRQSVDAINRVLPNIQAANDLSLPNFFANPTDGFVVGGGAAAGGNTYSTLELPFI